MIGSHLSIAGGLVNALREAASLHLECVQVFTKNQRQWSAPPLKEEDRDQWLAELHRLGWDDPRAWRVVSHNSYLINIASPDPEARQRSIDLQCVELERCEALSIPGCVMHPGAHLGERPVRSVASGPTKRVTRAKAGSGSTSESVGGSPEAPMEARYLPPDGSISPDERAGLDRIVAALDEIHRRLPGHRAIALLETTAGSGTNLGGDFAHLAYIRERLRAPERVGFCFDTCHVTAAGYDMSTEARANETWQRWEATCGFDALRCLHLNDSQGALGSHIDRHTHIGEGCCGLECFRTIMNLGALARVPKILETPKENREDAARSSVRARPWDVINAERLREMIVGSKTIGSAGRSLRRSPGASPAKSGR